MDKVIKILLELKDSSGNKLQDIIKDNEDNYLFRDILFFLYNPYIVTGLSSKKINKEVPFQIKYPPAQDIKDVFWHLIEHNTGTDIDIAYVLEFISKQKNEYKDIYAQIFTKELKLGITAKTINKVIPNLIPEFNVMLAEKYWDKMNELEDKKPNIIITQKLDGVRAVVRVSNHKAKIFSRQGKLIEGLNDLENEMSKLTDGCYDGELLLNKEDIPSKDLYRETVTIVNSKEKNKKDIIFNIFDMVENDEFDYKYSDLECKHRKYNVEKLYEIAKPNYWKPVPILYQGEYNKEIIQKELDKQISLQHEGIMINLADAPYEGKRTKNILKVKAMQDCDLKIIGFEEGTGKNKGTLGAVIVDYKGFNVKVGSGFTDKDRDYFWKNKDKLLGRVITVKYFEETNNKKDNSLSLRFPVYKELREDGKEVSYY